MAGRVDEVGYWSEIKLDIVRDYAAAYSKILASRTNPAFHHVYIDAFAGAGVNISRTTGEFIPGSPLNALLVKPPFKEYYLIDLDGAKATALRQRTRDNPAVHVYEGDCNEVLLSEVLPQAKYDDYRRALCLLDPYGLHLNWRVIQIAGQMRSIDMFLNFPIYDMNRNVLRHNPDKVDPEQAQRLTAYWGDESWRQAAYDTTGNLFGLEMKRPNRAVVDAFRRRLREVAGFAYVPEPMPMRNSVNAEIYYLFFASQQRVADDIVQAIFRKYQNRGK
jgi:three-Cys-motif partner protein